MNRTIIIIMMDFLISSFLLFINVNTDSGAVGYIVNNYNSSDEYMYKNSNDNFIFTEQDVDNFFSEMFAKDYLKSEISSLKYKLSEATSFNKDVRLINKKLNEQNLDLTTKNDSLQKQIESQHNEIININSKNDILSSENKDLKSMNQSLTNEVKLISSKNSKMEHEIQHSNEIIIQNKERISDLNKQLDISKKREDNLISELKSNNQTLSNLNSENASLSSENNELKKINDQYSKEIREYLKNMHDDQQKIHSLQTKIHTSQEELKHKYLEESQQQRKLLSAIYSQTLDVSERINEINRKNTELSTFIEDKFKSQFLELSSKLEQQQMQLKNTVDDLKKAMIDGNEKVISEAKQNFEKARQAIENTNQAMHDLDIKNAQSSTNYNIRSVANSRVLFIFDLEDNDWWSNSESFKTHGVALKGIGGKTYIITHSKPFGMLWKEFSDGLKKAILTMRMTISGNQKSQQIYNFETLSQDRSLIKVNVNSNIVPLPMHKFKNHEYSSRDLLLYSQSSPSKTFTLEDYSIDIKQQYLELKKKGWGFGTDFSEGDFIIDNNGIFVCMMVSKVKCKFIYEDDLDSTSDHFNLHNLKSFAKEAAEYSNNIR